MWLKLHLLATGAIDVTEELKAAARAPGTKVPTGESIDLKEMPVSIADFGHALKSIDGGKLNVKLCFRESDIGSMGPVTEVGSRD